MFQRVLTKIARTLGAADIPYVVIGGQAVLLYGEPRMTRDIDVTLGIDVDQLARVLTTVQSARFEILPADVQDFTHKTRVLPLMDPESGIRVDLIFSFSTYEQEAIRRARAIQIGDTQVSYASLEDL